MRAVVINLERSPRRREAMSARLAGSGLEIEFFTAVDGRGLNRRPYARAAALSDGELACYLSHLAIWNRLAESGPDWILVLEDDVEVAPTLAAICADLARLPFTPDLVRLSSVQPIAGLPVLDLPSGPRLLVPNRHPSGSQGYWLSRGGARRLLRELGAPERPVDSAFDRGWRAGLRVLLLDPPAVREAPDSLSDIGRRPLRPRPPRLMRKIEKWHRELAAWRLRKSLRKACAATQLSGCAPTASGETISGAADSSAEARRSNGLSPQSD